MDIKDYRLPPKQAGKNLTKTQRLALEIIKEFNITKEFQGRWFRIVKKYPAFVESKFNDIKKCQLKNPAACLWSIINKK